MIDELKTRGCEKKKGKKPPNKKRTERTGFPNESAMKILSTEYRPLRRHAFIVLEQPTQRFVTGNFSERNDIRKFGRRQVALLKSHVAETLMRAPTMIIF
jgi:hypothetical protein